ncbi:hypothetical protein HDU98_006358 [Podochytrium sp. JEL0797]|nr:hypothetical protein HDU98_006358 [Podochytrium sp. JEL0797]
MLSVATASPITASNLPSVGLAARMTSGEWTAPHPPSTHQYKYYQSFDWPGFDMPGASEAHSVLDCIKLSILNDYSFFSFQQSSNLCHFKEPSPQKGTTVVFSINVTIRCANGNTGCINQMSNSDFINSFSVLDRAGKAKVSKAKNAKACQELCAKQSNACAAATFSKGKCSFKQPVYVNNATSFAGTVWFVR